MPGGRRRRQAHPRRDWLIPSKAKARAEPRTTLPRTRLATARSRTTPRRHRSQQDRPSGWKR
eukprot:scaffold286050_cov41-Prasinocladus_malaysianus.AAC.1